MPPMSQMDLSAKAGKMRQGYRQNTFGFGQLLLHSPRLRAVLRIQAYRVGRHYRLQSSRGKDLKHGRSADAPFKIIHSQPSGKKFDRQTVELRVKLRNKKQIKQLRSSVVTISGGKRITRKGKIIG